MVGLLAVLLCCVLAAAYTNTPQEMLAKKEHEKSLPGPYHTTQDVLRIVQELSHNCHAESGVWSFEQRAPPTLEEMTKFFPRSKIAHGLADDLFDSLDKSAGVVGSLLEIESQLHNTESASRFQPQALVEDDDESVDNPPVVLHKHLLVEQELEQRVVAQHAQKKRRQHHHQKHHAHKNLEETNGFELSVTSDQLPVIRINVPSATTNTPKQHAFIMFGEHGREFVSCEIGLSFLTEIHDAVCNNPTKRSREHGKPNRLVPSNERVREILSKWDLTIMPIVSPTARQIAEKYDYCNRRNIDGVDINRNYPFHFNQEEESKDPETFAGAHALSEPETRLAVALAKETKPKLFVSVHSGSELIVTPPAYRDMKLEQISTGVRDVINNIHSKFCPECLAGPASEVLHYIAFGCSMDYMFEQELEQDNNISPNANHFSFTFETWCGDKHKEAQSKNHANLKNPALREMEEAFDQLGNTLPAHEKHCLHRFNPPPSQFDSTVSRWTHGLFETLDEVSSRL